MNIPILAPVESVEGNDDSPVIDVSSSVDVSTTTSVDASSDFVDSSSIEEIPSVNSSNKSKSSPKNKFLSSEQALNKLRKKLTAAGVDDELVPVSKGSAQFMLGYSRGLTRSLLTLYDTGCGGVIFREGVPQKELAGSTMKTPGPFTVNGVGDTPVTVNDEWTCAMELCDNTRQVMEGWTVKKITSTLPLINVSLAEAELKADDKSNQELQNIRCNPEIGGDCDILLGIIRKYA